jgi:hypothetical protein
MRINLNQLENFEEAPIKLGRKGYITEKFGNMWDLKRFDYHRLSRKENNYWIIKDRIFKEFLGKSVDEAYSKYCKKVKFYEKSYFWDEFEDHRWRYADYIIDSNKNIQLNSNNCQNKKKPVTFYSIDAQWGYYNTIWTLIKGYKKVFESKKDPEYKRLVVEKQKLKRSIKKANKKEKAQREYCFLSQAELKLKKSKKTDLVTRDCKGFDDKSFMGLEYHGQKRKTK